MKTQHFSILALVTALHAPFCQGSEAASVTWDNGGIAQGVRAALGDPGRFNWESVVVTGLSVDGGKAAADLTNEAGVVHARIHGDQIFTVTAKGKGDRDSTLYVIASVEGLDATISLGEHRAEVDTVLHLVNKEECRVWTRAKNQKTTPWTRMTFRVTAILRPCDVKLLCHVRVEVKSDGTVVLTPLSWRPTNADEKIDIKISGQNLPDGWAVIKPLNAETTRIDMDLPFDWGDRTIQNPVKGIMEKVIGREFVLGKLPL